MPTESEFAELQQYLDNALHQCSHDRALLGMLARAVQDESYEAAIQISKDILNPAQAESFKMMLAEHGARMTGWPVELMAMGLVEHLTIMGAKNHCQWDFNVPARDGHPARKLTVTAQWAEGETPIEVLRETRTELETARARIQELETALAATVLP